MFPVRHLALCAFLALGEAIGFSAGDFSPAWRLAAGFAALFALVGYGLSLRHWKLLAVLFLGLALALHSEDGRRNVLLVTERTGEPFRADLVVLDVRTHERGVSFDSSLKGVALRVMMPRDAAAPAVGETWRVAGWLEKRDLSDRRRRRVWISGRDGRCERVAPAPALSLRRALARVRARLSQTAGYGLSHSPIDADLDRAILLGERSQIPAEERQAFVDAGTVHVFAISGMHVMVIAWLLAHVLMLAFRMPLRGMALAVVPLLAAYVVMIGSPPSAVRAAVMAGVYFAAPLFWRKSDALVAWCVTFLAFHLWNPHCLYDVGSLLSFTVMLGILLFVRWAEPLKSRLLVLLGVPVAAWASGAAIVARVFGVVTPGGLLANFAMLPLASLAVALGFVGALAGCVFPWLGAHFNNAAALLVEAMRGVSWCVASLPQAQIEVAPWSGFACFAWYAVLAGLLFLVRRVVLRRRERL